MIRTLIANKDYVVAFLGATLLNIILFALMPGLIQTTPGKPELEKPFDTIQVIRIKRPDTDVRKKKKKEPPKPEKKEIQDYKKKISISKPIKQKIRLPFQLNPKLIAGNQTMSVPVIDMLSLQAPDLKNAYGSHEIDGPLTPLVKIPPMYPIRAKRLGIQGQVKIRFLVNTEGTVEHIEILDAHPKDVFDTSVINCVSKWRFKPGTVEGTPVRTWAETTIKFKMES